jgi:NADH dehydrogenase
LQVVTGASGYTGRYIAQRLLDEGEPVKNLTGHPDRVSPFGDRVDVARLDFDHPDSLAMSLDGADTLYNTYWIRFARGDLTFGTAVDNSVALIRAAERAGVRRIVHVSITNASAASPLPYFRGKGLVEDAVVASGLSYAILRPALIFGHEDVLVNNIAWALRRFPAFPIFGSGTYRVQPVYVEDLAEMAVTAAKESRDLVIDTVGPETYNFDGLVRLIAEMTHSRSMLVHMRPSLALLLTRVLGYLRRDVVLTRGEIQGLMAGLLVSDSPPMGRTRFSEWLAKSADSLGRRYASELKRHYR